MKWILLFQFFSIDFSQIGNSKWWWYRERYVEVRYPPVFVLHQLCVLTPRLGPRRESDTDYGNIFPLSPLDTGHSISIILIVSRRGWLHLRSPVTGLHLLLIFYTRGTEKIIGFIKIVESFWSNMWVLSFILNCNYR